jgi:hypothetical protein
MRPLCFSPLFPDPPEQHIGFINPEDKASIKKTQAKRKA